jgi:hypothetical protein
VTVYGLTTFFGNLEPVLCVVALACMAARKSLGTYKFLTAFIATRVIVWCLMAPFLLRQGTFGLTDNQSYTVFFILYWTGWAIEACFSLGIIISVYKLAMAPLKGLQGLGMMMFRWAAGISIALAITIAFGPHVTTFNFFIRAVTQLQQTQSVLTLCMLLFVCLAIHPMGLSFRSRIFGISLGLGILATNDLVQAAWISNTSDIYSLFSMINTMVLCSMMLLWIGYFAFPEPKRRMIVLPTTSPFLRWNQISQVLGDEPGFVALGEVGLDMFAPAEIEVMRRASNKMNNAMNY